MTWTNWAGNLRAPARVVRVVDDEAAVIDAVRAARRAGMAIRPAGTGHSFSPLCCTDGMVLSLAPSAPPPRQVGDGLFAMWGGMPMYDIGAPLWDAGYSLANQGDIDVQRISGAIGTGTHGTGRQFQNLSSMVRALRLVTGEGEVLEIDRERDPTLWSAAALSLGSLGVVTQVTMEAIPRYYLSVKTWLCELETYLETFPEIEAEYRNIEMYWLPKFDRCVVKAFDLADTVVPVDTAAPLPPPGTIERFLRPLHADRAYKVYPSVRTVPFVEMEFAVPQEAGPECVRELRRLILRHYPGLEWDVEYRSQAGDDLLLSPCYQRAGTCISVHQAVDLDYRRMFMECQAVFRSFQGRPHWGKLSYLTPREWEEVYPGLDA